MADEESLITCPAPFHNGRFVLESLIGLGGMAEVYRAYDQALGRWRAIKIMLPDYVKRRKLRARFETEAKAMALLEHPNIVRVYDVGVTPDGAPFIVMELCQGGSLEAWLLDQGAFAPKLAVDVTLQICDAISAAHAAGVIHRDIKSQNVLVGSDSRCKVTDFGIAQTEMSDFTNTGSSMGTLGFMAPEQRSDAKKVDARSDVYSIGATLYHLLTARVPTHLFAADQDDEILAGLDDTLLGIIKKATEYKREARYQTVAELAEALQAARGGLPDAAPGQVTRLRGDYTPPPVPRVRPATPQPAPDRLVDLSTPVQPHNRVSTPPTGEAATTSNPPRRPRPRRPRHLPPIGAHQPPPPLDSVPLGGSTNPGYSQPSNPGGARRSMPPGSLPPGAGSQPPGGLSLPPVEVITPPPETVRPAQSRDPHRDHRSFPPEGRAPSQPGYVEAPSTHPRPHSDPGARSQHVARYNPLGDVPQTRPPADRPTRSASAIEPRIRTVPPRGGSTAHDDAPDGPVARLIAEFLEAMNGPARILVAPILLLIVVFTVGWWWLDRTADLAESTYERATVALITSVDREKDIVDELISSGADATLLESHLADFEAADTPERRQIAARRLIGVAREELRRLPAPSGAFEIREHRRMQQRLDRLSTQEDAWEEAKRDYERKKRGLIGP